MAPGGRFAVSHAGHCKAIALGTSVNLFTSRFILGALDTPKDNTSAFIHERLASQR
jgi:hypothetical protein